MVPPMRIPVTVDLEAGCLAVRGALIPCGRDVIVSEPMTVKGRRVIAPDPGTVEVLKGQAGRHLDQARDLLARHPGDAGGGSRADRGARVRGEVGGGRLAREQRRARSGASAAATSRSTARALRTWWPCPIPRRRVAVAALSQMGKQVAAARERLPAGGAAKRDRGAEARLTALVVKQAQVVVKVPLRLEERAADLAVEGLWRGERAHVASSSRRLAASAAGSGLESPRRHGRLTEHVSIPPDEE